jgi:hypothetical protein
MGMEKPGLDVGIPPKASGAPVEHPIEVAARMNARKAPAVPEEPVTKFSAMAKKVIKRPMDMVEVPTEELPPAPNAPSNAPRLVKKTK